MESSRAVAQPLVTANPVAIGEGCEMSERRHHGVAFRLPGVLLLLGAGQVLAQTAAPPAQPAPSSAAPIIYPSKGQNAQQQEKDKTDCYGWARQQTGYDPAAAQQQQQAAAQQGAGTTGGGGAVGGAAKGAAAGAAVGAITGDAGTGAAVGAGAGAVASSHKKRKQAEAQQQAAQQQQAATSQQLAQYEKAFGACMEGRGYTVK
jgi:hypothetical protein